MSLSSTLKLTSAGRSVGPWRRDLHSRKQIMVGCCVTEAARAQHSRAISPGTIDSLTATACNRHDGSDKLLIVTHADQCDADSQQWSPIMARAPPPQAHSTASKRTRQSCSLSRSLFTQQPRTLIQQQLAVPNTSKHSSNHSHSVVCCNLRVVVSCNLRMRSSCLVSVWCWLFGEARLWPSSFHL